MFGISLEELIVLAVLAFILFGPQKLPEYAEKLGRLVAKIRAATTEVTEQFQNPFQYPPEPNQSTPQLSRGYATCTACHRTLEPGFSFCPNCGQRVKEQLAAPQQPQPPLAS
jgi:Sec-independent protein translocase protein TatA